MINIPKLRSPDKVSEYLFEVDEVMEERFTLTRDTAFENPTTKTVVVRLDAWKAINRQADCAGSLREAFGVLLRRIQSATTTSPVLNEIGLVDGEGDA